MKGYSRSREDFRERLVKKYFIPYQEKMEEIIENGCLGLWEKTTDYILTEWLLDALPTLYQQDEIIYQYNQWKQNWSKKSCTLFSPIGAVSDLWNIQIELAEAKERDQESYNKGRTKDSGWLVALWVDHICECRNKSKHWKELWKVAYYSFALKDNALLQKIFSKRYTVCTGYQWNSTYNADKNKDWILNGTKFWTSTYWHAVNTIRWINTPARIKDNYFETTKYNIYDVEHEYKDLSCFYERGYIITKVKEDNLERLKELNEMNTILLTLIENNSRMRHLTKDKNYQKELHEANELHRKKQKDVEEQLILLS